ncbi:MAG: FeoA family protein [Ruminococcus sp.]|nr:FeoA family protein [Ruminococcus sp.]
MKLSKMKTGQNAIIKNIDSKYLYARRLIEIGFSEGTEVSVAIKGMSPCLTAYNVKNTIIALRDKTAEKVNIILISGGKSYE